MNLFTAYDDNYAQESPLVAHCCGLLPTDLNTYLHALFQC